MKLHRVDLKVLDYNKRAIRCYEKCGFKVDGILRDSAFIEGAFHSDIIMSILEDEWKSNNEREAGLI
jgi:ribosomal-protein-alanine N-acetyltransferase